MLRGCLLVRVRGRGSRERVRYVELLLGDNVLVLLEGATLLRPSILEPNLDLQQKRRIEYADRTDS